MLSSYADSGDLSQAVLKGLTPGGGMTSFLKGRVELQTYVDGIGPELSGPLADPSITDIMVVRGQVWVDRGFGVERWNGNGQSATACIGDEPVIRALAVRLSAACGRRLDDACPIVDGTLPNGVRLHVVLPPLSPDGTVISLRVSARRQWTLSDLKDLNTLDSTCQHVIEALIHLRRNVMISGATGSGKTTLLRAVMHEIPSNQRLLCIEEVAELSSGHPHVVSLQERKPNVQGAGAVTLSDLVRAAMRMRPDRIILGECRGAEVREVLTALNTGHEGGWATLHANSVEDIPARLSALGALAGMDRECVDTQAVAALHAGLHMSRNTVTGGRYLAQVGVFSLVNGALECVPALSWGGGDRPVRHGEGWERLQELIGS